MEKYKFLPPELFAKLFFSKFKPKRISTTQITTENMASTITETESQEIPVTKAFELLENSTSIIPVTAPPIISETTTDEDSLDENEYEMSVDLNSSTDLIICAIRGIERSPYILMKKIKKCTEICSIVENECPYECICVWKD